MIARRSLDCAGQLRIVAATADFLRAEDAGGDELARALGVDNPLQWPPEFGGPPYRQRLRELMAAHPDLGPFGGRYIIGDERLVGFCGFKGPPDSLGRVEIGYSVAAPHQRRGYATGAVKLLLTQAFADSRVAAVVAKTRPDRHASIRVLERCGFIPIFAPDTRRSPVLCYERRRPGQV
jgi:ribosomal-protein-alanine N-acetyltransferase